MFREKLDFGKQAEELAATFLRDNGYRIIVRNYRTRLGEIDIIAEDKGVLCFIEVKARHSEDFGSAEDAVSFIKQRQIAKSAISYLKDKCLLDTEARFDVITLLFSGCVPQIKLIRNAFELDPKYTI